MKYGDILVKEVWWPRREYLSFTYRVDPVPNIHKRARSYFPSWYKTPRHINEKKQFFACDDPSLVRGKRTPINLPQPYDDVRRSDSFIKKSWKKSYKVRKQWAKHIVG